MAKWTAFPYDKAAYTYGTAALKKNWARLHAGDAEPLPKDDAVLAAWALFHAGEFQKACEAGLKAGGAGIVAANKAQCIYANYLEKSEKTKLALLQEAAERAQAQIESRLGLACDARVEILAGIEGDVDLAFGATLRHLRRPYGPGSFGVGSNGRIEFTPASGAAQAVE